LYSNQRLQRWCFDVELVFLAQQLKVGGWLAGWVAGGGKCCSAHGSTSDLHICCIAACPPPSLQVPMAEVQVTWTEIPGSKIRLASMAHMALELAMIKAGYSMGEGRRAGSVGRECWRAGGLSQRLRGQLDKVVGLSVLPIGSCVRNAHSVRPLIAACRCCAAAVGGLWKVRGAEEVGKMN
jgi:hypothetical protein